MASRNSKSQFLRTPYGGFKRDSVKSITPTDNGVAVFDDSNEMIFWFEEADRQKAYQLSSALMDAVIDGTQVDWDAFKDKPQLTHNPELDGEE